MRYHVILINGDRVSTDFDRAHPVRNPDGDLVNIGCDMVWCRDLTRREPRGRWYEGETLYGRAIPAHAIVGIIDSDCG